MDEDEEEARNRWAHLLNPIRDLAENWKINIASELEDYLGELVSIKYKIGTVGGLNFTEGAVGIYSKKVEYLFSLVVRSLEKITENKEKSKEKSSINPETGADEDVEQEEEIELLPLDDLKENADINMVEKTSNETDTTSDLRPIDNFMLINHQKDINIDDANPTKDNFRMNKAVMGSDGMLYLDQPAEEKRSVNFQASKNPDQQAPNEIPVIPKERIEELPPVNEKRNDPIEIPLINNLPLPESSEDEEVEAIEKEGQSLMLSQGPKIITRATQDQMDEPDPWEYWDPHDDCGIVAKPFKKGITYSIPEKTDKLRTSQQTHPVQSFGPTSILKPTYPEFQYIFDSEMKSRLEKQKKSHKATLNSKQANGSNANEREMQFTSGYDSGDDKILNALQGNEILDREEISSDEDIAENDLRSRILHLNDFSVPDHANLLSPTRYLEPLNNSMNDPEMSYEQLCRMHFEQSVRAAELYMQTWDSQLGAQVASWKSRLQPLLEIQESRPTYSVKSHAIEILETFPRTTTEEGIGESLPLAEIVKGQHTWEVCRSFVTMLHMINSGNVGINAKRDMKEGNDKLVFTLLSRKPPTDFENYAVPLSTNTNESKSEEENEVEIEEKSSSTNPKKQKSVSAKPKKTTPPTKKLPNQRKSSQK